MALVRRQRFVVTNLKTDKGPGGTWIVSESFETANVLQEVDGAVCWRCKSEHRRNDHLVHIAFNSEDTIKPEEIYHYRCIPSARWNFGNLAGSLPAWELPTDESPAENVGTSSAVVPTPSQNPPPPSEDIGGLTNGLSISQFNTLAAIIITLTIVLLAGIIFANAS